MTDNIKNINQIIKKDICKYCGLKECPNECFKKYLKSICPLCSHIFRDRPCLDKHLNNKRSCIPKEKIIINNNIQNDELININIQQKEKIIQLEKMLNEKQNEINNLSLTNNTLNNKILELEKESKKQNINNEYILFDKFSLFFEKESTKNSEMTENFDFLMKVVNSCIKNDTLLTSIQKSIQNNKTKQKKISKYISEKYQKYNNELIFRKITKDIYDKKKEELILFKKNIGPCISDKEWRDLQNIK